MMMYVVVCVNILHQIIVVRIIGRVRSSTEHFAKDRSTLHLVNRQAVTHEPWYYAPDTLAKKPGLALWETRGMDTVGWRKYNTERHTLYAGWGTLVALPVKGNPWLQYDRTY